MRIKHLFLAAFAALATVFTSCEKEEDLGAPQITVNPTEISFDSSASSKEVTLKATRAWTATAPEWIALSATSGDASSSEKTISVTVEPNKGNDRTGEVVFTIGLAKATLKVVQKGEAGELKPGSGTQADPYSVAGVIAYVESLGADVQSQEEVYVKGKVSAIEEAFSSSFGNGTFYITDDGAATSPAFYVFRVKFLGNQKWAMGNTQIEIGDEVIICSKVVNYKGNKPETVMLGATAEGGPYAGYLYSLNGKTEDEKQEVDYSNAPAKTVAEFIAAADKTTFFKLTGKVGGSINTQYGNFDLTDETGTIYVYGTTNIADYASKLVDGATVTLAATYDYYEKNQKHEAVNAYIISIEGGEAPDYSNAPAKTVAEFIAAADTQNYYKLTGKIGGSINTQYGNFDLTDETGTIYVYGVKNWNEFKDKATDGATVTLAGQYQLYKKEGQADKHEVVNAYILSCEGGTPTTDSEPKGSGTLEDPYNAAKALEVATALEPGAKTESDVYVSGKIASIKYTFSAQYGTATFDISDDGTTAVTKFTCYSVYYLGNRAWVDGDAQVKVGDDVVICGKLVNYKDEKTGNTTPETASKEAWIYSLNGETSIEQSPVFGVASQSVNVGAGATSATVKVTGNVAWTASSENATVSPASGTGAADITVSFAANTDTENAKTYTVTVSTTADVATKSYTVTITQGPAAPDGASTVEFVVSEYAAANGWENSKQYLSMSKDGVTLTAKGGGNTGKFYTSGNDWRFYQNESASLTVSTTGVEFVSVEFTYTIQNTGKLVDASDAEVPSGAASTSTTFNVKNSGSATNGQIRFTKIVVTVK